LPLLLNGGVCTVFAYGQTGSGKTFTMKGVQTEAIQDLYALGKKKYGYFYKNKNIGIKD